MSKSFEEFLDRVNVDVLAEACADRVRELIADGRAQSDNPLVQYAFVAMHASISASIRLLRAYHEWQCGQPPL